MKNLTEKLKKVGKEINNYYKSISLGLYEKALLDNLDWKDRLLLAKAAGYNFMEISIDETDERLERLKWDKIKIKKLRDIVYETEIPLITMCLSGNRRFPIGSSFKDIQKKGMEILIDAIYFAHHLGIRIIQVAGYDEIAGEPSTKKSQETYGKNLKIALKVASSLGVMLAIENVDVEFGDSLDKIIKYVKENDSPWLQLYPDMGNLVAMDKDVLAQFKLAKSRIAAIHIKDTKKNVVRRVPYGEGIVDFVSVFKQLKKISFYGPMVLEMWFDKDKDNFEIVKNARLWVLEKIKEAEYF